MFNLMGFVSGAAALLTAVNLGFAGNCAVGVPETFRYFQENSDTFDVVFAGSSYTVHQVDSAIFDDQCAKRGLRIRSINLAVVGATFYKIDDHLRRILAESPARLRYIIMDARPAEGLFRPNEVGSMGAIRWHTPLQTWRVIRRAWATDAAVGDKLRSTYLHIRHLAQNMLHVGCGRRLFAHPDSGLAEVRARDFPYAEGSGDFRGECEDWLVENLREYNARASEPSIEEFDLDALDAQMQLLSDHGVLPIFVATPSLQEVNLGIRYLGATNRVPLVLRMDDAQADPELFHWQYRDRFGCDHIARTRRVIDHYSRLLADRFVDSVAEVAVP